MMDGANSERVYDGFQQFHAFFALALRLAQDRKQWRERSRNYLQALLVQAEERHIDPLNVIRDNAPAHRGEAVREYLRTPWLRLMNLPDYSPHFNADETIWGWVKKEATGNLCLGRKAAVQERVGSFLAGLASRRDEVKRRCRTVLQSRAEGLLRDSRHDSSPQANAHPTLALV